MSRASNLDKTRMRIVRKGCTVRTGHAIVDWAGGGKGDCKACSVLEVLSI
jgi:hypothetical protein